MNYDLLIVGAGQLGSRHLQALARLDKKFNIYVLDPSDQSLDVAKQRYSDVSQENSPMVTYISDMKDIQGMVFTVCIVATNAAVRFSIVKQLASLLKIQNLLLEKVLFQSVEQLLDAHDLLEDKKIKTWVNCPRRQFPDYQKLFDKFKGAQSVTIDVKGDNWGLACNAIHFIDLWNYLTGFSDYTLDFDSNIRVVDSKRPGYKEIVGSLTALSKDEKHKLSLSCMETTNGIINLEILAEIDKEYIEIFEQKGVIHWFDKIDKEPKEFPFQVLHQSQLTHKVILDLIEHKDCELTPLRVSTMLHLEFLRKAAPIFPSNNCGSFEQLCPIT